MGAEECLCDQEGSLMSPHEVMRLDALFKQTAVCIVGDFRHGMVTAYNALGETVLVVDRHMIRLVRR